MRKDGHDEANSRCFAILRTRLKGRPYPKNTTKHNVDEVLLRVEAGLVTKVDVPGWHSQQETAPVLSTLTHDLDSESECDVCTLVPDIQRHHCVTFYGSTLDVKVKGMEKEYTSPVGRGHTVA